LRSEVELCFVSVGDDLDKVAVGLSLVLVVPCICYRWSNDRRRIV
jgi:hypothetical protein